MSTDALRGGWTHPGGLTRFGPLTQEQERKRAAFLATVLGLSASAWPDERTQAARPAVPATPAEKKARAEKRARRSEAKAARRRNRSKA